MKNYLILCFFVCMFIQCSTHKKNNNLSVIGERYLGKMNDSHDFVNVHELQKNPDTYVGKSIQISGKVTDVCPKKGCWIDLKSQDSAQSIRLKVNDGDIVFTQNDIGKILTAQGMFEAIKLSQSQSIRYFKHLADEKGEEFDPSKIKGSTTIYQINGSGVKFQ